MLGGLSEPEYAMHAEQLQVPQTQNCRFYEILAPYFRKVPPRTLSGNLSLEDDCALVHMFCSDQEDTHESHLGPAGAWHSLGH